MLASSLVELTEWYRRELERAGGGSRSPIEPPPGYRTVRRARRAVRAGLPWRNP
jgi:hypothetical protein